MRDGSCFISLLLALSMVLVTQVGAARNLTLQPVADAYVNSSEPGGNYAIAGTLYVRVGEEPSVPTCYAYLMFDLGSVPEDAVFTSAKMSVYSEGGSSWKGPWGKAEVGASSSDSSWTESGLTWDNRPSFGEKATGIAAYQFDIFADYKTWDITDDANDALEGGLLTEVLRFVSGSGKILYGSRESDHPPKLLLAYAFPPRLLLEEVSVVEDVAYVIDISGYIEDPDSDPSTIGVSTASPYITVQGHVLTFLYPEGVVAEEAEITLSDDEAQRVVRLKVTAAPVNDPPWIKAIPLIELSPGGSMTLDLDGFVSDPDNEPQELSWQLRLPLPPGVSASVDDETHRLGIGCTQDASGSHDLMLIVTDPEGLMAERSVSVQIPEGVILLGPATLLLARLVVWKVHGAP